eukprot:6200968-Pleurochrysis_carterae.AAC.2
MRALARRRVRKALKSLASITAQKCRKDRGWGKAVAVEIAHKRDQATSMHGKGARWPRWRGYHAKRILRRVFLLLPVSSTAYDLPLIPTPPASYFASLVLGSRLREHSLTPQRPPLIWLNLRSYTSATHSKWPFGQSLLGLAKKVKFQEIVSHNQGSLRKQSHQSGGGANESMRRKESKGRLRL